MKQEEVYQKLEKEYKVSDPWAATTDEYLQESSEHLLELIKSVPHDSILEVGCAQGYFTKELVKIAKDVTAIDVSPTAIEEAKKHVHGANFHVSSLEDFPADKKYDVIVCAEILYYIQDKKKALSHLEKLGRYLVTSHFITCFPQVGVGSIKYEWALRKFKVIQRIWEHDIRQGLLVSKTLWKL